jgi:hypothetical protein
MKLRDIRNGAIYPIDSLVPMDGPNSGPYVMTGIISRSSTPIQIPSEFCEIILGSRDRQSAEIQARYLENAPTFSNFTPSPEEDDD